MLKITGVQKTFNPGTINEKKALCGIDLTLNEGDFVTVIGGNGAGKSTMLNMIAAFTRRIQSQSAWPLYISSLVRPCTATAAAPFCSAIWASSTTLGCALSQPLRSFTVTGRSTASATA